METIRRIHAVKFKRDFEFKASENRARLEANAFPSTKRNHRRSEQLHSSEEGASMQQACAGDALEHTHLGCSRVGKEPSLLF